MSYKHKSWVIDGWTDWLEHAFGKGLSEPLILLSQQQLHPAEHQAPRAISVSFAWVARRETAEDMTLLCILWGVPGVVILLSFYPSSPHIDLSPGTPEAIRRCWLVSLSLAWSIPSILVNPNASHILPLLSDYPPLISTPLSSFPIKSPWLPSSLHHRFLHPFTVWSLTSRETRGPLSDIDSCFFEVLLFVAPSVNANEWKNVLLGISTAGK